MVVVVVVVVLICYFIAYLLMGWSAAAVGITVGKFLPSAVKTVLAEKGFCPRDAQVRCSNKFLPAGSMMYCTSLVYLYNIRHLCCIKA